MLVDAKVGKGEVVEDGCKKKKSNLKINGDRVLPENFTRVKAFKST